MHIRAPTMLLFNFQNHRRLWLAASSPIGAVSVVETVGFTRLVNVKHFGGHSQAHEIASQHMCPCWVTRVCNKLRTSVHLQVFFCWRLLGLIQGGAPFSQLSSGVKDAMVISTKVKCHFVTKTCKRPVETTLERGGRVGDLGVTKV